MDLSAILPLLLSKRSGKTDNSALLNELLKNSGVPPEAVAVMKSMGETPKKQKTERFAPILSFVNDDILGKLTRWFS